MSFQNGVKRRQFIAAASASLGVLALRGYPVLADSPVHFTHGVASGDPLRDRIILWTRVLPGSGRADAIEVDWQVASDESFSRVVASGSSSTDASRDYTVKVDAQGLEPGRSYFYRFSSKGVRSATGKTATLPAAATERVRLAVVSCSNYPQGYFHVYRELAKHPRIDAVIHLGDYIYEYAEGGYANPHMLTRGRNVKPEHEIVSLEDYRMRYGLYRSDADLQAAHQMQPFICVWDDHEITNNAWKHGAENHNAGEGPYAQRCRAAVQAYYEWMPIREYSPVEEGKTYRSFDFGDLASLIMLDTRLIGRDQQLSHSMPVTGLREALADERRSILGHEQEAWLEAELKRSVNSGKPWQIIGQQVLMGKLFPPQFGDEEFHPDVREQVLGGIYSTLRARGQEGLPMNMDAWDGYPACRERVFAAIQRYAHNAVVLAGDTHSSWAFNLRNDRGEAVAVEFATPSISSPGFEDFLPVDIARLEQATLQASPELHYCRAGSRGWLELEISRESVASQWMYVSTVQEKDYGLVGGARLVTRAGKHLIES